MNKFKFRQEAIFDLNDIWNYTYFTWSANQAERYFAELEYTCEKIAINPSLGKSYEHIAKNLFAYKVKKHIIFYQRNLNSVEFIRILHVSMDFENQLKAFI